MPLGGVRFFSFFLVKCMHCPLQTIVPKPGYVYLVCLCITLHALSLCCVKLHIFGLGQGFQAACKDGLAHAQRFLPAFFSGSCLSCCLFCFFLSLCKSCGIDATVNKAEAFLSCPHRSAVVKCQITYCCLLCGNTFFSG